MKKPAFANQAYRRHRWRFFIHRGRVAQIRCNLYNTSRLPFAQHGHWQPMINNALSQILMHLRLVIGHAKVLIMFGATDIQFFG